MKIISRSVNDTIRIGKTIAGKLLPGDIICLYGELGSGKTVLAKGIADGLGVKKAGVASPSFILIRQHSGKVPFYHFDLYRLEDPHEILGLGYEEFIYGSGVAVVEWADKLGYLIPSEFLSIELSLKSETQRQLDFNAFGERYKKLLEAIHEVIRH